MVGIGVGLIANPKNNGIDELEENIGSIPSDVEVSFEPPEISEAEILSELANQRFVIKGNEISNDDQEIVVAFGKAFVNLYTGSVAEQRAASFENYISNVNLHKFANKMLELEQRKESKGGIGVIFGLENEFKEAEFNKLDENLYYVSLPFSNKGSGMNLKMLVQAENKELKIVDFFFGNKDGVDTIVTGHPAVRGLRDPKLWDDHLWVDGVFEKLEKYEFELNS